MLLINKQMTMFHNTDSTFIFRQMFNSCEMAHVNIHKHSITNLSNVLAGGVTILMDNNNITLAYTIENMISFANTLMI